MQRNKQYCRQFFGLVITLFAFSGCLAMQPNQIQAGGDGKRSDNYSQRSPKLQQKIELQASLMSFADRFAAQIDETSLHLESQISSPTLQLDLLQIKTYAMFSAIEIAAGPYPGVSLLDMVVMVTLNRLLWQNYWKPQEFGEKGDSMLTTLKSLEGEIWVIAGKYLTDAQQRDLRDLIFEWREKNPDQLGVSYIRFSDFGSLGRKPTLEEARKPGGLLAPVSEATRAVDEVRMLGERLMYLLHRSQILMNYQFKLAFREMAVQPETQRILSSIDEFNEVSQKYAVIMAELPVQLLETSNSTIAQLADRVAFERKSAINQLMSQLARERKQFFADIVAEEQRLSQVLPLFKQTLDAGTGLAAEVNRVMVTAEPLLASLAKEPSSFADEPMRVEDITAASRQVTEMVYAMERLLSSPGWEKQLPRLVEVMTQVESRSEHLLGETFEKTIILILVSMVGLVCALLLYRFIVERFLKRHNQLGI